MANESAPDRKTKALKTALEELHKEVKNAEMFYQHIHWLQERFPKAEYEDVTGLCKLASPAEVKEQEYSLNPGRYVGVVIEEDGKTEEEFIEEILKINDEIDSRSKLARQLDLVIGAKREPPGWRRMNSWKPITIGELIDNDEASLQTGPFGTQLKASEYAESGIRSFNVKNIGYGDIRNEDLDFVPERTADRLRVHRLRTGDIVFGRKGAADRHALIGPACDGWLQGSDCMRLRLKSKRVMARFLLPDYFCAFVYYFLHTPQKWIDAVFASAQQCPHLTKELRGAFRSAYRALRFKTRSAGTLYAYDERIDSNKRRIALLETLAGEIYREWFVRIASRATEKDRKGSRRRLIEPEADSRLPRSHTCKTRFQLGR